MTIHRWKILFSLWSVQALAAFVWLTLIPSDAESGVLFGFSAGRLALLGVLLAFAFVAIALFFYERLPIRAWLDVERRSGLWDFLYLAALFVFAAVPALMLALRLLQGGPQYAAYAERISPLAVCVWLCGLELMIVIASLRPAAWNVLLPVFRSGRTTAVIVFSILLAATAAVSVTKVGLTAEENMGAPATPLFEWQVGFILFALLGLAFLPPRFRKWKEGWIIAGLYILTLTLWLSQPIQTAYTATPPRAPNFEIYPFSDPQIYSQYAQSALVGNGFLYPEVPSRPLYIAFLTWLHLLGRQDYNHAVVLQSLVLAWFPVMLYLIGRELNGRALGFALGMTAAFRDMNANWTVPYASNVTYSKLFLSETPLALLVGLFAYLTIVWLKRDRASVFLPALAGVALGAAALIRTQSAALIVVVALIAFLAIPRRRQWLIGIAALAISFSLTLLPWLARNYAASGGLTLDNPVSQVMTMARRWSGSWGNEIIPRQPGESDADYSSRMMQIAIDAFQRNPQYIIRTAANHFINSEIASLMVFPVRDTILSPDELWIPKRAFWSSQLGPFQLPSFIFLVILFGVGVAAAFRRHSWVALLPLGLGLLYNLWTALFFSSGERFIMPLDWSVYLYQWTGLLALGAAALLLTQNARESGRLWFAGLQPAPAVETAPGSGITRSRMALLGALIVFVGFFTPFTEFAFPKKYPDIDRLTFERRSGLTVEAGETFLYGRAIYPRYYFSGEGEPGTAKLGYQVSEQPRLVFFLVGTQNGLVVFELQDAPEFFPHASDVYLVGAWEDGFFSPRAVFVAEDGRSAVYSAR